MAEVQEIPHLEWETPLYRTALAQYEQALPHADVDTLTIAGTVFLIRDVEEDAERTEWWVDIQQAR